MALFTGFHVTPATIHSANRKNARCVSRESIVLQLYRVAFLVKMTVNTVMLDQLTAPPVNLVSSVPIRKVAISVIFCIRNFPVTNILSTCTSVKFAILLGQKNYF